MSETPNNKTANKTTAKLRTMIIAGFAVLVPVMLLFVIMAFNMRMGDAMKKQTADMVTNLNMQIKVNTDSYLEVVEGNVHMITSDEEIKSYAPGSGDKKDPSIESIIEEKLSSYAIYSNYLDYGIVYSDGTTLGNISNDLKIMGADRIYTVLDKTLKKTGGWSSEIVPNRGAAIYLSRINDVAIAVGSIPSEELTTRLKGSLFIDGMNIYVTDKSLVIISTTDADTNPGSYMKTSISRSVDRVKSETLISDNYVVATQKLKNDWFVVAVIPSADILTALQATNRYVIVFSVVASLLALGYVIYVTQKIVNSVNQTMDKLDVKAQTDLLTGLTNKRSFEELVDAALNNPEDHVSYALIFMDIDNFKGVNDRCGHDVGDMVLKSFSHTIDTVFRETDIKGRLGGDEFCVLMKMTEEDRAMLTEHVNEVCRRFVDALHRKANSARQSLPAVTSSMGAALWDGAPEGFEELYHKADTALYASKNRGKDTWSIYGQDDVKEAIE